MPQNIGQRESTRNRSMGEDHYETPAYAVVPLLPYIKSEWNVWECTDSLGTSKISSVLRSHGCTVQSTGKQQIDFVRDHLFFSDPRCALKVKPDIIVTNPPYNQKDEFIAHCIVYYETSQIRSALLVPITTLEGKQRGALLGHMGKELQLIIPNRRVEFTGKSCWFPVMWLCIGMQLPAQLNFVDLQKE